MAAAGQATVITASPSYEITDSGLIGRALGAATDVRWIDNERVVLIGAQADRYVEPEAGRKERQFRLFIWQPKRRHLVQHLDADIAMGSLCVFKDYVRLEYSSDYRLSPESKRVRVFEGTLGYEKVTPIDAAALEARRSHAQAVNPYTCKEYDVRALPKLGVRVSPLLDGEYLSKDREPTSGEVVHWKFWPRQGNPVLLKISPEVVGVAGYSRYLDSYILGEGPRHVVFSDSVVRRSWLLDHAAKITDFTPPSGPWMRGSTTVTPTKRGMFLTSHAVDVRSNGAAGGYLLTDGRLLRIIAGLPVSFDVSPDGCGVVLSIYDKTESKVAIPRIKSIDICSRGR